MSNLDKDYLHDLFIEEASAIRVKHKKVETAYQDGYETGYAEGVGTLPKQNNTFIDSVSGIEYELYVQDGSLMMKERGV